MENVKKYWYVFLLLPVVLYVGYIVLRARMVNAEMEKVRRAKADKALTRELINETDNDVRTN